jgi:hypothetical protein
MESSVVFRRWVAIATLSAAIERKAWIDTGQRLFPNLYVWLVGQAAIGKSRPINLARGIARKAGLHVSRDNLTDKGLIDTMRDDCISTYKWGGYQLELWNSMFLTIEELSTLLSSHHPELTAVLTKFFDCDYYGEAKRGDDHRLDIEKPHMVMLCGTTPAGLLQAVPDHNWSQGLMSRVVLVHSTQKDTKNILDMSADPEPADLIHDLKLINKQEPDGVITTTQEFRDLFHAWRNGGCQPAPSNPRLRDYCSRRDTHFLKLAMIVLIDRGDPMVLTAEHYHITMRWLLEVERTMGGILMDGDWTPTGRAMGDIIDWGKLQGGEISDQTLRREIRKKTGPQMVDFVLDSLKAEGRIRLSKTKAKFWVFED